LTTSSGQRLDRHAEGRIVRRVARKAGLVKKIGPHTLRHAFITAALDAGVPLRDVQEAASHADPPPGSRQPPGAAQRAYPHTPHHPGSAEDLVQTPLRLHLWCYGARR
jgi:integrase